MPVVFNLQVAIFLAVFVLVVVLLIRMTAQARRSQAQKQAPTENAHEKLLLRFVEDQQGLRIGESVAAEGDDLIVKDGKGFLAIPASGVAESGEGLRLTAPIDESAARQRGEAWRAKSHKVISYSESELPKDEAEA
jgi:hypothetical protein